MGFLIARLRTTKLFKQVLESGIFHLSGPNLTFWYTILLFLAETYIFNVKYLMGLFIIGISLTKCNCSIWVYQSYSPMIRRAFSWTTCRRDIFKLKMNATPERHRLLWAECKIYKSIIMNLKEETNAAEDLRQQRAPMLFPLLFHNGFSNSISIIR